MFWVTGSVDKFNEGKQERVIVVACKNLNISIPNILHRYLQNKGDISPNRIKLPNINLVVYQRILVHFYNLK